MVGDIYIDAFVANWSGGDGICDQCGSEPGTSHILWKCPGKEVFDSRRKCGCANPLTAELIVFGDI